jgi:hypothetical protein
MRDVYDKPQSQLAWPIGANADRPVPTKLARRRERHSGPRNLGMSRRVAVAEPRKRIYTYPATTISFNGDPRHQLNSTGREGTDQSPIEILERLRAIEPEMQAADEIAQNQRDDADIVELEPAMRNPRRVVHQRVVRGRDEEAECRGDGLQGQHGGVEGLEVWAPGVHVVVQRALAEENEQDGPRDQVRVDVARLVVPVQPAGEGGGQGARLAAVAGEDEGVGIAPGGQVCDCEEGGFCWCWCWCWCWCCILSSSGLDWGAVSGRFRCVFVDGGVVVWL